MANELNIKNGIITTIISATIISATTISANTLTITNNIDSTNKNLINPFHLPFCQIEPLRSKWLRQKQQNLDKE